MEPSGPTTTLRGHRKTPCVIHGWSSCPYSVASRQTELSSSSMREGGEGGRRCQRRRGSHRDHTGARFPTEADTETHVKDQSRTAPPPPSPPLQQEETTTLPPLLSHVGGQILRRFTHFINPSRPDHRPGAWDFLGQP
jgi:hypothetical protein